MTALMTYPIVQDDGLEISPVYRQLQQHGPVKVQQAYGEPCWVATSYADCKAVHGDRRFVKELSAGRVMPRNREIPPLDPSMLANMDPPRHTRIRKLTTAAFARPRIRDMKSWVEDLADELLDDMVQRGEPADFCAAYASNLPNLVLTGILGVPRDDAPMFRGFVGGMLDPTGTPETRARAGEALRSYILSLVEERRRRANDDVLSDLVERYEQKHHPIHTDDLTEAEMVEHLLEAKGVTRAEVARRTRVAESTLAEVLAGKRRLTREQMEKLAAYFHVTPAVFWPAAGDGKENRAGRRR